MHTSDLVGMWKLESRAGKTPAELGCKAILKEFKEDGTYIEAGKYLEARKDVEPAFSIKDVIREYYGIDAWKDDEAAAEGETRKNNEIWKLLSRSLGILPGNVYFAKGTWKMEDGILQIIFEDGSYQAKVVTLDERFEMVYLYPNEPDHKTVLVAHKRFVEPQ